MIKKHQASMAEINNHESRIDAVSHTAQLMVKDGHFESDDIKSRLSTLRDHWDTLKELSSNCR